MKNCPKCSNTSVDQDGYCGECRERTIEPPLTDGEKALIALPKLIAATQNLLAMFVESHQVEIETNHRNDGRTAAPIAPAGKEAA